MAAEIVDVLSDIYRTMLKMTGDEEKSVVFAPARGHVLPPDIEEALARHKSPEVIQLIRLLPYACMRQLAPASEAINYIDPQSAFYQSHFAWRPVGWDQEPALVLPQELALTAQEDGDDGMITVVDTRTWTASLHRDYFSLSLWPERSVPHETKPAVELLQEWLQNFQTLRWMVRRGDRSIITEGADDEYWERTRKIFLQHGWPDQFRADDCQDAIDGAPGPGSDVESDSEDEEVTRSRFDLDALHESAF